MEYCLALDDGGLLALDDGGCLLVVAPHYAGIRGIEVRIGGVEYTALRGVTIERRLNEVGQATVEVIQGIDTEFPQPGDTVEVRDRDTQRALFHGTIDEPVGAIGQGLRHKTQTIRAVDGMRRLEDLRLTTAQAVALARFPISGPILVFNIRDFLSTASDYDSGFVMPDEPAESTHVLRTARYDFRGKSYADALRFAYAQINDGVLHVGADRVIRRAGKQSDPVTAIDASIIESINLDRDRQHQHTRQCAISAEASEYTDTFNANAPWYDIAQSTVRRSIFDLDTPVASLPGVLWRFLTDTPNGYNYSDSNKHVLVNGESSRTFYHAPTPILASATTHPAYVYYADWSNNTVRLRFGSSPTTRDNNIQFVPAVSPAMLGIDTRFRVIQRRLLTGSGPYELTYDGLGLCTVTGNPAFSTGNAIWRDVTSVIVDLNEPRINYELATTQDTAQARPDLRVERLSRVVIRDVTSQDSNPHEQDLDAWRLVPGEHRVYPPNGFTLATDRQLEITYTARWEVEADVGGSLPIVRHTQAAQGQTIEQARNAALLDIQQSAEPVDILEVQLTLNASRHVEPGERWRLPDSLIERLGIDPAIQPVWIVDSVRIADIGDRLSYACRLTRSRHSSAYREYWQSLQS